MKYCTNCGKEVKDDETKCPSCGETLENVKKEVDVSPDKLCPNKFFISFYAASLVCSLFGVFALFYKINNFNEKFIEISCIIYAAISIACFIPTIVLSIIGSSKGWTHVKFKTKTSTVRFFAGFILGGLGLILSIVSLFI